MELVLEQNLKCEFSIDRGWKDWSRMVRKNAIDTERVVDDNPEGEAIDDADDIACEDIIVGTTSHRCDTSSHFRHVRFHIGQSGLGKSALLGRYIIFQSVCGEDSIG